MKRSGRLERSEPLRANLAKTRAWERRSRKALPSESPKRRAERPTRDAVRAQVRARAGYQCQARELVPEISCWHPPGLELDVDEIVLRSGRPGGHLDPDNCQALCRAHHDWKHDNPDDAVARGLRRWSTQ